MQNNSLDIHAETSEAPGDPKPNKVRSPRRWRRRLLWAGGVLLVLAVALELYARFYLGLGDPPLWIPDPKIEYRFQPNQDGRRFGCRYHYNQWSMRSDDFPAQKSAPDELRILVVGDSVVNGGNLTDQEDLATTLLQQKLTAKLKRPVVVGNISAGSWGPPNQLAYLQHFGLFQADAVVLVLSSHDVADVPTFVPLDVNQPTRKPVLALEEAIGRYLPHYLPWLRNKSSPATQPEAAHAEDVATCLKSVEKMVAFCRDSNTPIIVAQHWTMTEINRQMSDTGHEEFRQLLERLRVARISLGPTFATAIRQGGNLYRDDIHPSPAGQRVLADVILAALEQHGPVMQGN